MTKLLSLDEAVKDAAENLVNENVRILNTYTATLGAERTNIVALTFLKGLVATLLYKVLKQNPGPLYSKEEVHDLVQKEFGEMKLNVQDAVSGGFQHAMSMWSGMHVEYYCQVRPVPEPLNKKLC